VELQQELLQGLKLELQLGLQQVQLLGQHKQLEEQLKVLQLE
jgi:hypothetical protein